MGHEVTRQSRGAEEAGGDAGASERRKAASPFEVDGLAAAALGVLHKRRLFRKVYM